MSDIRDRRAEVLTDLPTGPGVYQMFSDEHEVLYVGKARNLKKRVTSYFRRSGHSPKTEALMQQVQDIEVTLTHTEGEALLLENNLIKSQLPRFNVMLRDDKGYPYIFLSDQPYPRLEYHRGAKREKGRYFGPYPSAGSVRESLKILQKIFGVRQCNDSYFSNRSRPCLQYQLKRCSGPCVGLINEKDYARDVAATVMFLEGKTQDLGDQLIEEMDKASADLNYELAAVYRDRIAALTRIQEKQYVEGERLGELDIIAARVEQNIACVDVTTIRNGRHLGRRSYFPVSKAAQENDVAEILAAFLSQYYGDKQPPDQVLLNHAVADTDLLEAALSENAKHKVTLRVPQRGAARRWMQRAELNAAESLNRRLASRDNFQQRFESLQQVLGFDQEIERIECFDISHTMGEATVGSCVVYTPDGPLKTDYRRFNIEGIEPGDDYGAMRQALTRRFRRIVEGEGKVPDVLLIDGGKGQMRQAREVIDELQLQGILLAGITKGEGRRAVNDRLFLSGNDVPTILPDNSPAMHLVQQIRDEAHRFAITGHRKRRGKKRSSSSLEEIAGVGEKRRQSLLRQLGGLQEVARAGVEDLSRVPGISPALAQKIYDAFHDQDG